MQKNIDSSEAYLRTTASIGALLFALFLIENPIGKILFATVAAALAGTAFLRSCPIYTFLKKNDNTETPHEMQPEETLEVAEEVISEK
jgi:Protein of unknown function (DUF2892)